MIVEKIHELNYAGMDLPMVGFDILAGLKPHLQRGYRVGI
ncbi:hypothetical protein GLIP_2723 [Aliiglaciecola lipolytica E3]|uniref:Uncharacterized protein n=1 Tax=Aliiglaciecola lipolytica E3 TaxID=1127673 RepID=K6YVS7_9ALTE|nr:hypothetical protein GLIP_2723 [Aliiglaciecola lipolytica E3]